MAIYYCKECGDPVRMYLAKFGDRSADMGWAFMCDCTTHDQQYLDQDYIPSCWTTEPDEEDRLL